MYVCVCVHSTPPPDVPSGPQGEVMPAPERTASMAMLTGVTATMGPYVHPSGHGMRPGPPLSGEMAHICAHRHTAGYMPCGTFWEQDTIRGFTPKEGLHTVRKCRIGVQTSVHAVVARLLTF